MNDEILLAVVHANKIVFDLLVAQHTTPANNMGKLQSECIKPALEIALNAHKRSGVTQGQMKQLEVLFQKAEGLSK